VQLKTHRVAGERAARQPVLSILLLREEFVVVGWTDPEGSRSHIGALLLGYYTDDGKLHYAGRAGTGITDKELKRLAGVLKPLQVPRMPLAEPPSRDSRFGSPLQLSRVHWVRPEVVVEVTYLTWTEDNLLRQVVSGTAGGQARQAGRAACCPSASALALKGMVTEAPPGLGPGKSGAGLFRCGG